MTAELERALEALAAPLRFISRNDYEHVDRVKDLDGTLKRAIAHAQEVAPEVWRPRLARLAEHVPPPEAPRAERIAAYAALAVAIEQLRAEPLEPAPAGADQRPSDRTLALDAPVQFVKGVGPRLAELLAHKGLVAVEDLLRFLPRRYEDRRGKQAIRELTPGTIASVEGEVMAKALKTPRGRRTLDVALGDATGVLRLKWFRVPGKGFADRFEKGRRLRVSGPVTLYQGALQMVHPETQVVDAETESAPLEDAIVPIYGEVEGLRPAHLRNVVAAAVHAAHQLPEVLPLALRRRHRLPALSESLEALHAPPPGTSLDALHAMSTPWQRRLIYEELFLVQLAVLRRQVRTLREPGWAVGLGETLATTARRLFPFTLTRAQQRVLAEIESDLKRAAPMNRLLQGDVGSGKTAVALAAAVGVAQAGAQAAIMAPTEILAEQHARVALPVLQRAGIRAGLLTGATGGAERRELVDALVTGSLQVIVGTHALIQDDVQFKALALAVVDEQHRFGVMQRARLVAKGRESLGSTPHTLVMTATPIPRTLALTVYGDLDISLIDELPPGRRPVHTELFRDRDRAAVYARARHEVEAGRQAYVVFPLIEGSDAEGMSELRDLTSGAEYLAEGPLAGLKLALLHGRMSADDKDRVMRALQAGEVQVLVATTVIEVGIDVPNASVMVVEHAERFGLSQLHQLRGRVGRGAHKSFCFLIANCGPTSDAWRRLKVMEETSDGFRIAEEDLAIRGPGDFLGTRQAGLPLLSVANLARDQKILQLAREDATALLARDPELEAPEHQALRERVTAVWRDRLDLANIG